MINERIASILVASHMSEKASIAADSHGQYTFKVLTSATKPEIKQAVEAMFQVKVDSVQTVSCKGKTKRTRKGLGRTKAWKKAYVQLAEGQQINMTPKEVA